MKKARDPGRVTDFQTFGGGFLRFQLILSSAGTGTRIRSLRMTRRTILFSSHNNQSQNNDNPQNAVESEHIGHGSLLNTCLVLSLYLPTDESAIKKFAWPAIVDEFTNIFR